MLLQLLMTAILTTGVAGTSDASVTSGHPASLSVTGSAKVSSDLQVAGSIHAIGTSQLSFDTSNQISYAFFGNFSNPSGTQVGFSIPNTPVFWFDSTTTNIVMGNTFSEDGSNAKLQILADSGHPALSTNGNVFVGSDTDPAAQMPSLSRWKCKFEWR